ncbi:MAG TPA: hypothetical protein VH583_04665 [Vicinamibacterales bacterium]
MNFDDELRRVVDAAVHELRTLAAAAQKDAHQEGLDKGKLQALDEGRSLGREQGRAEGVAQGRAEGIVQGRSEGFAQGHNEGLERGRVEGVEQGRSEGKDEAYADHAESRARLVLAMRALDAAGTLNQVLDTLLDSAGREAGHASILMVHGDQLTGWRSTADEHRTLPSSVNAADATVIREAVQSKMPVGDAFPITLLGDVVAVLSIAAPTDSGDTTADDATTEIVEMLVSHAARCLERLTVLKAAHALTNQPANPPATLRSGDTGSSARRHATT